VDKSGPTWQPLKDLFHSKQEFQLACEAYFVAAQIHRSQVLQEKWKTGPFEYKILTNNKVM
jgi:hypothetical protein